jgi:hypothetical protein
MVKEERLECFRGKALSPTYAQDIILSLATLFTPFNH